MIHKVTTITVLKIKRFGLGFLQRKWKLIPKLSLLSLLIWNSVFDFSLSLSPPPPPTPPPKTSINYRGWSGGALLGKLPVPGRPTIWMIVGQGPIELAVGVDGGCLDIFTLVYPFSPLSPFLWETAQYRLKYCLKGLLNPKQPTNQPINYNSP